MNPSKADHSRHTTLQSYSFSLAVQKHQPSHPLAVSPPHITYNPWAQPSSELHLVVQRDLRLFGEVLEVRLEPRRDHQPLHHRQPARLCIYELCVYERWSVCVGVRVSNGWVHTHTYTHTNHSYMTHLPEEVDVVVGDAALRHSVRGVDERVELLQLLAQLRHWFGME